MEENKVIDVNETLEENIEMIEDITVEEPQNSSSVKDQVMEDGKLTVFEFLYVARYFLPLLSSVGFALGLAFTPNDGSFLSILAMILIVIGWVFAITVCPLKFLFVPFKWAAIGFKFFRGFIPFYGIGDLIAAIFGLTFGFAIGVAAVVMAPALFTIPKFFAE